jgi:hypothetical protein
MIETSLIKVTPEELRKTREQVFFVTHKTAIYPDPLSELNQEFDSDRDAWYSIIHNRLLQNVGEHWKIDNPLECAKHLWEILGDIPINDDEEIEEPFLTFEVGTDRGEIWSWFEYYFDLSIYENLMFPK